MDDTDGPPTVDERAGSQRFERPAIQRYLLGERIGRGGMGEVLAARDEQIGREVAIKRLRSREPDDRAIDRFLREACIQGRLQHPAIPPVHEIGRDPDGLPFFVMKKLSGTTLSQILAAPDGRFTRQRLLRALADVCLAIELAHTKGIVHRDLKPANLMFGDFGEVYVLDWGVALVVGDTDTTIEGIVGTPRYMAPEQRTAAPDLDARVDVYALGRVLADILAIEPDPPPELAALVERASEPDRDKRIATARELADAIQRYLDGDRDLALRKRLAEDHLARARAATDRRDAIREAGRAIALDPTLSAASGLVAHLMLEPPETIPQEVEDTLARNDVATNQRQAKTSVGVYFACLAFLPFIIGYREGNAYVVAFFAVVAINAFISWRRTRVAAVSRIWALNLRNVVLVVLLARMFSPFLLAPTTAVLIVMALLFTTIYKRSRDVAILAAVMIASILGTWALEVVGLISESVTNIGPDLVIHAPQADAPGMLRLAGLATFVVGTISFAAILAHTMQRAERAARRQLELQAWQLRQLVA